MLPTTALLVSLTTPAAGSKRTKRNTWRSLDIAAPEKDVTLVFTNIGVDLETSLTKHPLTTLEDVMNQVGDELSPSGHLEWDQEVKFIVNDDIAPPETTFSALRKLENVQAVLVPIQEPTDEDMELLQGAPDEFRKPNSLLRLVRSRTGWDRCLRAAAEARYQETGDWQDEYHDIITACPILHSWQSKEVNEALAHIFATEPEVFDVGEETQRMFHIAMLIMPHYEPDAFY